MSGVSLEGKVKHLVGNMGWMTISNFASKVLVFLLVPYYTRVLSTGEYGLYDLGYTAVILLAPVVTANSGEALMRFSLVEKESVARYFSAAFAVSLIASAISMAIGILAAFTLTLSDTRECVSGTAIYLCASIQYALFSQFARGIDHVKDMAFGGLINSAVLFLSSVVLISGLHLGLPGCFLAGFLGCGVGATFIALRCGVQGYLVQPRLAALRELARYGIPLSINSLGWWMNSSFSRYATAFICGISGAGLLAAAYRIPSIPKAVQQIFIQAWQISSIESFDSADTDGFFGEVYNISCWLSSLLTSSVIMLIPVIAGIMFSDEFYTAWKLVPLLMLCIVFDCLASVIGGVFSAIGNTKPIALSAFVSMLVVIASCAICIPIMGVQGAAVASVLSSVVVWATRLAQSRAYASININWRSFSICMILLAIQTVFALALDISYGWYIAQFACFLILLAAFFSSVVRPRLTHRLPGRS